MSSRTDARLTPSQRLSRGLKYSAVGPVDVTLGTVGLSWQGAQSAAGTVRRRLDKSRLAQELGDAQDTIAQELAAAQEVLASLPQVIAEARKPKRRRRPLVLAAVGVVVLAGGAVAFSIIRRSSQPEPSAASQSRPPSVDVSPKP
ncbi:cell wall synthesis protein CwsA [Mycobacterium sp.]|uniref:cell wall synthesis protein CwsA n=1 Tax=Mycobacterium sp. TaxID=1785 RepID=UPI002DAB2F3E|nr:cell wall synthesis protein CwsA [Mycobacterium sp.]